MLLTSLPAVQTWGADIASRYLAEKTGARVSIGRLRLKMTGHVTLDNVKLYDLSDTLMLRASRIAAKIDLMQLPRKKIRIPAAQIIGAQAKLYKDGEAPFNFQFLVDAFSSQDTTSTPQDLGISALVVRRGEVSFDRIGRPVTPGRLNPDHLHIKELNLTARILAHMPDTLAVNLRNLSLSEQSGLRLQKLSFEARAGQHNASIRDFLLEMPESSASAEFVLDKARLLSAAEPIRLDSLRGEGKFSAHICPHELAALSPALRSFDDIVNVSSSVRLDKGIVRLQNLSLKDNGDNISLLSDAAIAELQESPSVEADIRELCTGPSVQQFLTENLQGRTHEVSPVLTRMGSTKTSGSITYRNGDLRTDLRTESEQGTVRIDARIDGMKKVEADISASDVRLGHLLDLSGEGRGTAATIEVNVTGTLPAKDRQANLQIGGKLANLTYKGYEYRNIPFSASINGDNYSGETAIEELNLQGQLHFESAVQQGRRSLSLNARVKDFAPFNMNLTKRYEGERFSVGIEADFSDISPNRLQGELHLRGLELASQQKGNLQVGDIDFTSNVADDGTHLRIGSDFLRMRADGKFNWKTLPATFLLPFRQNLPSLFALGEKHPEPSGNDFRFVILVRDTLLAGRLLDTDLRVPAWSWLDGTISDAVGQIAMQLNVPTLQAAGQHLQNITCRTEGGRASLQTSLQFERIMKGKPVELNFDAYATADKVTSRLRWDNKRSAAYTGDISLTGFVHRDLTGQTMLDARMNPSRVIIGDTLWHIQPATISYHDHVVDVSNLSISQAERHIDINGRISALDSDTLRAELADIDIAYVMDLVNFHSVDFGGKATGSIYATSLMKKPFADAYLQVHDFTFNEANLGNMDLYANWGKQERAILLEADMRGPIPQHHTQLNGTIIPGKEETDGLNLNIQTSYFDLAFLKKFTKDIFRDLQGRTSGRMRIFGPFDVVNLEGNMYVNEMKMNVPAIGTDYHLAGDSVILRADNIWLHGARIYDRIGMPGMDEHMATVEAHLMHDALKDLSFDISIDAHNLLGYNFPHQGGSNFYGTAYADAQVHLYGGPGTTTIDVEATPMPGTTLTYNAASRGAVSEEDFVTYVKKGELSSLTPEGNPSDKDGSSPDLLFPIGSPLPSSADLRVNLNINANPNAQIRLLMDPRTGDNISIYGDGRLHANYYNKGRFQLYGTYRVSEGNYRMSIRDLITKDFVFQPDGTVVFGGNAMQAALNLTAKHTVLNVSLDDLSSTGLGLANTRVDCIMRIGGIIQDPAITFDFDLPNANEDEKQMVRSMLSSEEERDMQAIYLLGVGRFYTYGTLMDTRQTKGGMAMNSVLSSALSSRFNQIMSQALGGSNWSFGTNLRTGEAGWEHLDVEGMLSGKMLSGRLQFNGNFGYRENKYKMNTGSFIGDFDLQYRLSPRSPFSLKAYNQTNDRYFTQSSLTTQGIGIKFQRDFTRFMELFRSTRKNKK